MKPEKTTEGLIEICGSVVPFSEVERVWKLHCATPQALKWFSEESIGEDYSYIEDFGKKYKTPYVDEKDSKNRIRLLEERLYTSEWSLNEVRATRTTLLKLLNVSEKENEQLKQQVKLLREWVTKMSKHFGNTNNYPNGTIGERWHQQAEEILNQTKENG